MFNNKNIDSLALKYLAAIKEFSDERDNGNGYWIYLKEPYFNPEMECRIIHEQQIRKVISILKDCVNNHK